MKRCSSSSSSCRLWPRSLAERTQEENAQQPKQLKSIGFNHLLPPYQSMIKAHLKDSNGAQAVFLLAHSDFYNLPLHIVSDRIRDSRAARGTTSCITECKALIRQRTSFGDRILHVFLFISALFSSRPAFLWQQPLDILNCTLLFFFTKFAA